ncbi:MAG: sigma 54-interacting transcriptional regulator [Bacillota bacterium]
MEYNIGFIAPYKSLAELFGEVCNEMGKNIKILIGDLDKGVEQAIKLEEKGYDAVISRGGTALAIQKKVTDLPVIEVPISGYDLIRVLAKARKKVDKIAVIGFHPFTKGEDLGKIMDIDFKVLTLKEEWYDQLDIIKEKVKEIKNEGYKWVVGDNISVIIAREMGMKAVMIKSGKEALIQALREAEKVVQVRKKEKEKTKRIHSIINYAYEGIISVDQKGIIDTFNPKAEKILDKESYKVVGESIDDVIPELNINNVLESGQKEQEKIITIDDKKIVANIIPVVINEKVFRVVCTFQEVSRIKKMEEKVRGELYLKGYTAENQFEDIIGESKIIKEIKEEAADYAQVDLPLLIYGETGTGKELFSQAVHNASPRRNKPFVAFNCAALPKNLLESELFGYVEGAFTGDENSGAQKNGKPGLFEQTHEGTIFLDEIGDLPLDIQTRLLRVIQEQKIRRLGDDKLTTIDIKIITATKQDLYQLVKKGEFRQDLYYRINVLNLTIPPLRKRKEDIPFLVDHFIKKNKNKINKVIKGVSAEGMNILKNYRWPGNVRQLENIIERLIVRTKQDYILTNIVKEVMNSLEGNNLSGRKVFDEKQNESEHPADENIVLSLNEELENMEKEIIYKVLHLENGNKTAAAKRLGIGRSTLWRKLKQT